MYLPAKIRINFHSTKLFTENITYYIMEYDLRCLPNLYIIFICSFIHDEDMFSVLGNITNSLSLSLHHCIAF